MKKTGFMKKDFRTSSMCHPKLLPPCVAVAIKEDSVGVRDTKDPPPIPLLCSIMRNGAPSLQALRRESLIFLPSVPNINTIMVTEENGLVSFSSVFNF